MMIDSSLITAGLEAREKQAHELISRILLVEDDVDTCDIKQLLDQHYQVEVISSQNCALATLIAQRLPDLLVVDLMLPALDGVKLLRQLRGNPRTAKLRIILLSTRRGKAPIEAFEAGADDYLVKPFSPRELLARVRTQLELAQNSQQLAIASQHSEEHYRTILDAIPQIVWMNAANGQALYLNQRWQEYTGIPASQSTELDWMETVHRDDLPDLVATQTSSIQAGKAYEIEYRIKRFDQTYRWHLARVAPFKNPHGEILYWFGSATDVHDIKQIEAEQRFLAQANSVLASSLDYKTTLANIATLAVPFLADGCFVDVVTPEQTIERVTSQPDPAQPECFQAQRDYIHNPNHPVARVLASGKACFVLNVSPEWRQAIATHPEDFQLTKIELCALISVPLIVQTRTLGALTLFTTASQRGYNDADLQLAHELARCAALALDRAQLYEQAQAAERTKEQFLAMLSHELRSPLHPILGWSKLLLTQKTDRITLMRGLETIERHVNVQAQLIDDLLDVSRILQGKLTLQVSLVDLKSTIVAATETVCLAAQARSIQVEAALITNCRVAGDPVRLQQIVWNLLFNAVKFTPKGGRVEVRLEQIDSCAQIQVSDTGKGIEPEILPYIFDCFRQADGSTTRKYGGLGLGLAIVRHLVELHGGTIAAISAGVNQGTTFTVRLPVVKQSDSLRENLEESHPINMSNTSVLPLADVRILVVDDEIDSRELVAIILEQAGATVLTAASATKALEAIANADFDVMLCDIGMPETDGYSLLRQIQAQFPDKQMSAVALTAFASVAHQHLTRAAGFQMHLVKPIEPTSLVAVVASLCGTIDLGE